MAYIVESTEPFAKEFYKRHKDKWERLERMKEKLKDAPESGKPLSGKLHGLWQLRIDSFRIWYVIDEKEKKVTLKMILHKSEAKRLY